MSITKSVGAVPFFWPLAALSAGIGLANFVPLPVWFYLVAAVPGLAFYIFFKPNRQWIINETALWLLLSIACLGATKSSYNTQKRQQATAQLATLTTDTLFAATPSTVLSQNQYFRTYAATANPMAPHPPQRAWQVLLIQPTAQPPLHPGFTYAIMARPDTMQPPPNPGMFNALTYYRQQGYAGQLSIKKAIAQTPSPTGASGLFWAGTHNARLWCQQVINKALPTDTVAAGLAHAVLLGNRQHLPQLLKQNFASAGIVHLLAVSGLHVGILYWLIGVFFRLIPAYAHRHTISTVASVVLLWGFAFLTGMAAPVVRAVLMFTLFGAGQLLQRQPHGLNTLLAAGFFMLLLKPDWLFSAGFQLSFMAVAGIVTTLPVWQNVIWHRHWLPNYLFGLTTTTLSAQLLTLPLVLYYFHQFPMWFLPANLLAAPIGFALVVSGLLMLFTGFWSGAAAVAGGVFSFFCQGLNVASAFFAQLPAATLSGIYIFKWQILLYYLALASILYFWHKKTFLRGLFPLLAVLALGLGGVANLQLRSAPQQTVVYHVPNNTAVAVYKNGYGHLACTPDCLPGTPKFNFYLKNALLKACPFGYQTDTLQPNAVHYLAGANTYINLLNKNTNHPQITSLPGNVKHIVVGNNFYPSLWPLTHKQTAIIDGQTHWYKKQKITEKLKEKGVKVLQTENQAAIFNNY